MNAARTPFIALQAAAWLVLALNGPGQENPSPTYADTSASQPPSPCCEECEAGGDSGGAASCSDLPHCDWAGSVFFSVGLGRTPFIRDIDYSSLMKKPARELCLPGAAPPGFASTASFYQSSPLTGRRTFHLWYHQESFSAASFEPAALVADPGANCEKIMLEGAVRQILTDDRFADIQDLADVRQALPSDIQSAIPANAPGFAVRTWFAGQQSGKEDGLYGLPASSPLGYVVYYQISLSAPDGSLGIILRRTVAQSTTRTESWVHQLASGAWTSTHYKNMPDSGTPLEEITRTPDGQNPLIQTHVVKQAPINPDTGDYGEPVPVSHAEEEFADVGGLRRLIRRTAGSDLADGLQRTTRFGWVNAPENSAIHGLLQWQLNPDRSFVHHSYPTSTGETSGSIVTLTPWKGTTWTPTPPEFTPPDEDGCIVESTAYDGTSLAIQREVVNGKGLEEQRQLVSRETQEWTSTEGLNMHTRKVQYGAGVGDVLTTTTAYSATDGRIAWRELPDGTAETYSYSGPDTQGNYTQTVAVGAGSRNGVSSGTWTMTTRNQQGFATAVEIRHSATPNTLSFESWAGGQFDLFGRPGKRTWNAEVNDYDETVFGCCGISSFRDRNGITEDYSRDYLKRLYKTVRTAGSNVVTTNTSFSGLVTETKRKAGSDPVINVLVSKTTRLSNGEIDQVAGPDQDNLNVSTGEITSYSYSYPQGGGHSVTVTHPGDGDETTTYLVDGRVAEVSGSAVADATYDYDVHSENGGGTATIVTRPSVASPTGEWTKTCADLAGRPFRVQYPTEIALAGTLDHSTTSYHAHNASAGSRGKVASTTDPDGVIVSYTYDPEGERYQTTETMPGTVGNRVTTTAHDIIADGMFGTRRTTTTVNGVTVSEVLVSDHGRTTRTILPDTDPNNDLNVASTTRPVISAAGAWTETSTHPDGTRIRQVFADGLLQSVERRDNTGDGSGLGALISSTSHQYDALGRLWKTTDSRTGDTLYTNYTEAGNPRTVTAPGNRPTSYQHDQRGRVTQVNQPDTDITNPDGTITTDWPNVTDTSYYPTGEVKAVWGDQSYATFRVYDEQNRLTELRTYQTLAHGTIPTAATPGAATTSWSYHPQRGWLTAKEYPDGQDAGPERDPGPSYAYTAAGRLKSRTWGGGKHTRYDYRRGMLVARRHFTSATSDTGTNSGNDPATPDTGFAYNAFGQLQDTVSSATTDHPSIRWFYVYDVTYTLRRMRDLLFIDPDMTFTLGASDAGISLVGGPAPNSLIRNLYRSADPLGRHMGAYLRQNLLLTTGLEVGATLAYDAEDGRLATVTGDFVGSTASFSYGYAPDSNTDLIASVTSGPRTVTNQWETSRDVLDFKENWHDTTLVSKYDYGVNKIGQRTTVTASGGAFTTAPSWNWGYNPRGELTSSLHVNTAASSRYYAFDAIGSRSEHRDGTHTSSGGTPTSYTPNDLNQYNAVGALNPTYQLDGNMTAGPLPAAPAGNSSLVWNGENQLVEVTPFGGSAVRYHYDAFGRRVAKTAGTTRTYWFYDDWNPVAEYTGPVHTSGAAPAVTLNMTWLWGIDLSGTLQGAGGVGGLLAATIESGLQAGVYFPIFDGNGNVGQYLDASGVAVAKYEYDGFGRSFAPSGTHAALFPHRFSTKPLDSETGLYYYGYRYYDPVTGRWPSRDPIEERGGVNLYSILGNRTIGKVDFVGLASVSDGAYAVYWDLDRNKEYEMYPGGEKGTPHPGSDAVTLLKYRIFPKCKCVNHYGGDEVYVLEEIELEIYSEIHLWNALLHIDVGDNPRDPNNVITPDRNIAAYGAELDHAGDYARFAEEDPKPLRALTNIETKLKRSVYMKRELCEEAAKEAVLSDDTLASYSREATIKTRVKWDERKQGDGYKGRVPHQYFPGWMFDPAYERYKYR